MDSEERLLTKTYSLVYFYSKPQRGTVDMYPLRERKRAKQKLALMMEFVRQLEHVKFQDIIIKEICHSVEISEGTFYNYFPKKSDVIRFFRDLQFMKMMWRSHNACTSDNVFDKLVFSLESLIGSIRHPHVLCEFISVMVSEKIQAQEVSVTGVELECAFPGYNGIDTLSTASLNEFFEVLVREAIDNEELPKTTCLHDAVMGVMVVLGGVLLSVEEQQFSHLKQYYHRQLKLLWTGLQVEES